MSPTRGVLRFIRTKPLGAFGGAIVLVMVLLAVAAEVVAPFGYNEPHLIDRLKPPSLRYILGTDALGRDVFSMMVYGARVSLLIGLGAVAVGTLVGTLIGMTTGYYGGRLDLVAQRVVDAWMSFPWLVILLTIMAIFGAGFGTIILALGISQGLTGARVIRSATLSIRQNLYVESARAIGAVDLRIMARYLLPNVAAPILVLATVGLGSAILIESSLSFLGFGVPPPHPSWGGMLSGSGRQYLLAAPWLAIVPGAAITGTVFGFNMLGDALRDVLDPRLTGSR